ncbi:DUF4240 domain-containing protein [Streptomyces sp. NPDC091281]|uniref:DUF4240 domain-containing protein n=1 Tax=Streptomyces sp. NPDC091281 TaxID=3365985 RepID=UPI0037F5AD48
MDDETFWNVIERCRAQTRDPDERLLWLRGHLAERPEAEILRFQVCLDTALVPTFTWDLWAAADRMLGWCSDDVFFYFRLWLVGLGRDTFERVARSPDALADVPQIHRLAGRSPAAWPDEEVPEWEELDYVAARAFEDVTGRTEDDFYDAMDALRVEDLESAEPVGERWDAALDAEASRRLPRLSALFPATDVL